jgi:hypothetical protein
LPGSSTLLHDSAAAQATLFPDLPSVRFRPRRYAPGGIGNWSGHLPFAADVVAAVRPALLVELGTHYGESYFGFCQAIEEQNIACRTYAVDTWTGDPQSGFYASVFEDVSAHNAAHYPSFSTLLRMSFDEASAHFADGTIDLLHLDGLHTYDAVRHDFENWLPKVSPGGIVLLHDTFERGGDFGVWKVWEEVSARFPSFAFHHSCGLGVLAKRAAGNFASPFLTALLAGGCDPQRIRNYYVLCAERLSGAHPSDAHLLSCRLFCPDSERYPERSGLASAVPAGEWTTLQFDIAVPAAPLRLAPVNRAAVVEIADMVVESKSTGGVLWRLDPEKPDEISCGGTAIRLPGEAGLIVVSYGDAPRIYLPPIDTSPGETGLRLSLHVRMDPDFGGIAGFCRRYAEAQAEAARLRTQVETGRQSAAGLARVGEEIEKASQLAAGLARVGEEIEKARQLVREETLLQLLADKRQSETESASLREAHRAALSEAAALRQSLSWRITAPLRLLGSLFQR